MAVETKKTYYILLFIHFQTHFSSGEGREDRGSSNEDSKYLTVFSNL